MFLEELSVVNFRNLENQTLKFNQGVVVFWGDNAQGKTNLLEAIYLLSTAKSFRTRSDHELITWGLEEAKIAGKAGHLQLELRIKPDSKELVINKQPKRLTDIIGSFIAVLFTPGDVGLVSGPPNERRRFLDYLSSILSKEYLYQLVAFNRLLKSRNQVLYRLSQGSSDDLWVWNKQLTKSASFIWEFRLNLIKRLSPKLRQLSKKLTKGDLKIDYQAPLGEETREKIAQRYLKKLESLRDEEVRKKQTVFGPHRDDFKLIFEEEKVGTVVSKDLGIYGSRGEQRSAALTLKLSEVGLIEEDKKATPVLLLDEVLSEFDEQHRELLLRQVYSGQTFITSTSFTAVEKVLGKIAQSFEVRQGKAEKSKS